MFIRGVATLLFALCATNLVSHVRNAGHDATIWWLDLREVPASASVALEIAAVLAFAVVAIGNRSGTWARGFAAVVFLLLAIVALCNAAVFYRISVRGDVIPAVWVPLSLVLAVLLAVMARRAASPTPPRKWNHRRHWIQFAGGFATAAIVLPLAQMLFFGTTDYRRPADAIVVFGAAVDADGRPSLALADRVETACRLYHEGRARVLIFSGGPGPGRVDEADAMRSLALRRGVPAEAIVGDHSGVTTDATVRNTAAILDARQAHRVLAVSHSYHLPRVKLAYQAAGREVFTVPAHESRTLARMPYYVLRETAAMWVYYARGVVRPM